MVQRVEVEARHHSGSHQVAAHLGRVLDTERSDGSVIVLRGLEDLDNVLGRRELAELGQVAQRGVALDRQDAGHDGTRDADSTTVSDELEEGIGLEEELRDDKVGAGIDLLLEVREVLLVVVALGMAVRITERERERERERWGDEGS